MELRISHTFTTSLAKLTSREQKVAKNKAFDLQVNLASPGMKFHRLDGARDSDFWSVRVGSDLRLIVHRQPASLLLVYVDHHDDAYQWARRRKITQHPTTGAAQLVEVRETVEEVKVIQWVKEAPLAPSSPALFASTPDDDLRAYGVPEDWLDDVKKVNEASLYDLIDHLPEEAAEALVDLATGTKPQVQTPAVAGADPFSHPDAQRRFTVATNVEELERALEFPWDSWAVFLHPAQRRNVDRDYNGPARISGSAGTGKTIVALHRAVLLARRHPDAVVLVTTLSKTLATDLKEKLGRLIGNEPLVVDRVRARAITEVGCAIYEEAFHEPTIAPAAHIESLLRDAAAAKAPDRFPLAFLLREWTDVVDAWQLTTWEAYRDVARLGRRTRLGPRQREELWSIFSRVRADLAAQKMMTMSAVFGAATAHIAKEGCRYDFAVVDEAQDMGVAEVRLLAALGAGHPDGLFFAGDLGQRTFQQPFSWKSLAVDVRGRSHALRICYRTSHQIRRQADRLLPGTVADVDGIEESREGTVSVFTGIPPRIETFPDSAAEAAAVGAWIADLLKHGTKPHEIGVFVRDTPQLKRAKAAVKHTGTRTVQLNDTMVTKNNRVSIGTMHLAKGLEYRAVAVMACDEDIVPLQSRMEAVSDTADLEDVHTTERQLLYVACTRARDKLLVTGVAPGSEFLDDMVG